MRRLSAVSLVMLLLTSCASAVGEQQSVGSAGPVEGGTLRLAVAQDLVPGSIFGQVNDGSDTVIGLVYDSLVDYPHDSLQAAPALATSWKVAEDARSVSVQLRDDVRFHNGKPFTSKDVQFSIETFADPAWAVQLQRTAAAVTGFDTSDPHAITLTFEHPMSNVVDLLDIVPMLDADTFDQVRQGKGYNGTGAFKFSGWEPGSKISFARNDDYWRGKPHLQGVEVSVVPDSQAQVAGLRTGQYDLAFNATARDTETLSKDPKFTVNDFTGATGQTYVGFNLDKPELGDIRLRQAVAYAIDRKRIADEVYRGAVPQNLSWSPDSPAYNASEAHRYDRDVDKAKELVGQLRTTPVLPLQFQANNASTEAVAQIVQSNLADVGITVELKPSEHAQMYKQLVGAEFDGMWIFGHTYAQYHPATLAVSAYPFNADHNASNFDSDDYRSAANDAWQLADPDGPQAKEVYGRLNSQLLDNLFLTDLVTTYPRLVSTSEVHGINLSKRTELDLHAAYKGQ